MTETVADTGLFAIGVGVHVSGTGIGWFDDLSLEVDGRAVTEDLSFTAPTDAQRAWLRARAVPFATPEPGSAPTDMADLAPLGRMVGDARIVSLGEATHGTRESYQAKHRIFSYLVRDHGFSVLMLEANQLAAERINQYVLTGRGSAREALEGVFKILQTQEVLDLVEWARAYNESGAGRLEIVGYDMQDPRLPIDSVRAFLGRADPRFAPAADSAYRGFAEAWNARAYPNLGDSAFAGWERGAERVRRHVDARSGAYLAAARTGADTAAVRWAVKNAAVAHDASRLRPDMDSRVRRDSAMAVNALWHLAQRPAGTRAAIWAHNSHVSRAPTWMGAHLDSALPGSVLVVGFTSAEGTYRAALSSAAAAGERRYGDFAFDPAPPASLAHALAETGADYLLVDMRDAADAPDGRWILEERPSLSIGGAAVDYGHVPEKVGLYYDVLVVIRRTTAARAFP